MVMSVHGQWLSFIENELDYRRSTAYNLIKVANEFNDVQTFGHITSSKVFALLDMPQGHREDFMQKSNIEDSTVRELKAEIQYDW